MKAITAGVLYKRKRGISWRAVVVQRQAGLVGSFCSSFWVVFEEGQTWFWVLEVLSSYSTSLGNSNMLSLIFGFIVSGLWWPPVIHFTWENEEEKCGIQKHCAKPFS